VLLVDVAHVRWNVRGLPRSGRVAASAVLYVVTRWRVGGLGIAARRGVLAGGRVLAIFHFVRQQWGWVMYRGRGGERDRAGGSAPR
jgi:hypothetical protein